MKTTNFSSESLLRMPLGILWKMLFSWIRKNAKKITAVNVIMVFLSFEMMWVSGYASTIKEIQDKKVSEQALGRWDKKVEFNGKSITYAPNGAAKSVKDNKTGMTEDFMETDGKVSVIISDAQGNVLSQKEMSKQDFVNYFKALTSGDSSKPDKDASNVQYGKVKVEDKSAKKSDGQYNLDSGVKQAGTAKSNVGGQVDLAALAAQSWQKEYSAASLSGKKQMVEQVGITEAEAQNFSRETAKKVQAHLGFTDKKQDESGITIKGLADVPEQIGRYVNKALAGMVNVVKSLVKGKEGKEVEVSIADIQGAAEKYGIRLKSSRGTVTDLKGVVADGPAIAHLNTGGKTGTFVVVKSIDDDNAAIINSDGSESTISVQDFEASWSGKMMSQKSDGPELVISEKKETKGRFYSEFFSSIGKVFGGRSGDLKNAVRGSPSDTEPVVAGAVGGQISEGTKTGQVSDLKGKPGQVQSSANDQSVVGQTISQIEKFLNDFVNASPAEKAKMAASLGVPVSQLANITAETASKIIDYLKSQGEGILNCAVQSLFNLFDSSGKSYSKSDVAAKAILVDIITGNVTKQAEQGGPLRLSMNAIQKTAGAYGVDMTGYSTDMAGLKDAVANGRGAVAYINTPDGQGHFVVVTGAKDGMITYTDADGKSYTVSESDFQSKWSGQVLSQEKVKSPNAVELGFSALKQTMGASMPPSNTYPTGAGESTPDPDASASAPAPDEESGDSDRGDGRSGIYGFGGDDDSAARAAEEARKAAEDARKAAEEAQRKAEEARKKAEEARKAAVDREEQKALDKAADEAERAAKEAIRKADELAKIADKTKTSAERKSVESVANSQPSVGADSQDTADVSVTGKMVRSAENAAVAPQQARGTMSDIIKKSFGLSGTEDKGESNARSNITGETADTASGLQDIANLRTSVGAVPSDEVPSAASRVVGPRSIGTESSDQEETVDSGRSAIQEGLRNVFGDIPAPVESAVSALEGTFNVRSILGSYRKDVSGDESDSSGSSSQYDSVSGKTAIQTAGLGNSGSSPVGRQVRSEASAGLSESEYDSGYSGRRVLSRTDESDMSYGRRIVDSSSGDESFTMAMAGFGAKRFGAQDELSEEDQALAEESEKMVDDIETKLKNYQKASAKEKAKIAEELGVKPEDLMNLTDLEIKRIVHNLRSMGGDLARNYQKAKDENTSGSFSLDALQNRGFDTSRTTAEKTNDLFKDIITGKGVRNSSENKDGQNEPQFDEFGGASYQSAGMRGQSDGYNKSVYGSGTTLQELGARGASALNDLFHQGYSLFEAAGMLAQAKEFSKLPQEVQDQYNQAADKMTDEIEEWLYDFESADAAGKEKMAKKFGLTVDEVKNLTADGIDQFVGMLRMQRGMALAFSPGLNKLFSALQGNGKKFDMAKVAGEAFLTNFLVGGSRASIKNESNDVTGENYSTRIPPSLTLDLYSVRKVAAKYGVEMGMAYRTDLQGLKDALANGTEVEVYWSQYGNNNLVKLIAIDGGQVAFMTESGQVMNIPEKDFIYNWKDGLVFTNEEITRGVAVSETELKGLGINNFSGIKKEKSKKGFLGAIIGVVAIVAMVVISIYCPPAGAAIGTAAAGAGTGTAAAVGTTAAIGTSLTATGVGMMSAGAAMIGTGIGATIAGVGMVAAGAVVAAAGAIATAAAAIGAAFSAAGAAVSSAMGLTGVAGSFVSGFVSGALSSMAMSMGTQLIMTGSIDFGQVLKSGLTGGLTAGIMQGINAGFDVAMGNPIGSAGGGLSGFVENSLGFGSSAGGFASNLMQGAISATVDYGINGGNFVDKLSNLGMSIGSGLLGFASETLGLGKVFNNIGALAGEIVSNAVKGAVGALVDYAINGGNLAESLTRSIVGSAMNGLVGVNGLGLTGQPASSFMGDFFGTAIVNFVTDTVTALVSGNEYDFMDTLTNSLLSGFTTATTNYVLEKLFTENEIKFADKYGFINDPTRTADYASVSFVMSALSSLTGIAVKSALGIKIQDGAINSAIAAAFESAFKPYLIGMYNRGEAAVLSAQARANGWGDKDSGFYMAPQDDIELLRDIDGNINIINGTARYGYEDGVHYNVSYKEGNYSEIRVNDKEKGIVNELAVTGPQNGLAQGILGIDPQGIIKGKMVFGQIYYWNGGTGVGRLSDSSLFKDGKYSYTLGDGRLGVDITQEQGKYVLNFSVDNAAVDMYGSSIAGTVFTSDNKKEVYVLDKNGELVDVKAGGVTKMSVGDVTVEFGFDDRGYFKGDIVSKTTFTNIDGVTNTYTLDRALMQKGKTTIYSAKGEDGKSYLLEFNADFELVIKDVLKVNQSSAKNGVKDVIEVDKNTGEITDSYQMLLKQQDMSEATKAMFGNKSELRITSSLMKNFDETAESSKFAFVKGADGKEYVVGLDDENNIKDILTGEVANKNGDCLITYSSDENGVLESTKTRLMNSDTLNLEDNERDALFGDKDLIDVTTQKTGSGKDLKMYGEIKDKEGNVIYVLDFGSDYVVDGLLRNNTTLNNGIQKINYTFDSSGKVNKSETWTVAGSDYDADQLKFTENADGRSVVQARDKDGKIKAIDYVDYKDGEYLDGGAIDKDDEFVQYRGENGTALYASWDGKSELLSSFGDGRKTAELVIGGKTLKVEITKDGKGLRLTDGPAKIGLPGGKDLVIDEVIKLDTERGDLTCTGKLNVGAGESAEFDKEHVFAEKNSQGGDPGPDKSKTKANTEVGLQIDKDGKVTITGEKGESSLDVSFSFEAALGGTDSIERNMRLEGFAKGTQINFRSDYSASVSGTGYNSLLVTAGSSIVIQREGGIMQNLDGLAKGSYIVKGVNADGAKVTHEERAASSVGQIKSIDTIQKGSQTTTVETKIGSVENGKVTDYTYTYNGVASSEDAQLDGDRGTLIVFEDMGGVILGRDANGITTLSGIVMSGTLKSGVVDGRDYAYSFNISGHKGDYRLDTQLFVGGVPYNPVDLISRQGNVSRSLYFGGKEGKYSALAIDFKDGDIVGIHGVQLTGNNQEVELGNGKSAIFFRNADEVLTYQGSYDTGRISEKNGDIYVSDSILKSFGVNNSMNIKGDLIFRNNGTMSSEYKELYKGKELVGNLENKGNGLYAVIPPNGSDKIDPIAVKAKDGKGGWTDADFEISSLQFSNDGTTTAMGRLLLDSGESVGGAKLSETLGGEGGSAPENKLGKPDYFLTIDGDTITNTGANEVGFSVSVSMDQLANGQITEMTVTGFDTSTQVTVLKAQLNYSRPLGNGLTATGTVTIQNKIFSISRPGGLMANWDTMENVQGKNGAAFEAVSIIDSKGNIVKDEKGNLAQGVRVFGDKGKVEQSGIANIQLQGSWIDTSTAEFATRTVYQDFGAGVVDVLAGSVKVLFEDSTESGWNKIFSGVAQMYGGGLGVISDIYATASNLVKLIPASTRVEAEEYLMNNSILAQGAVSLYNASSELVQSVLGYVTDSGVDKNKAIDNIKNNPIIIGFENAMSGLASFANKTYDFLVAVGSVTTGLIIKAVTWIPNAIMGIKAGDYSDDFAIKNNSWTKFGDEMEAWGLSTLTGKQYASGKDLTYSDAFIVGAKIGATLAVGTKLLTAAKSIFGVSFKSIVTDAVNAGVITTAANMGTNVVLGKPITAENITSSFLSGVLMGGGLSLGLRGIGAALGTSSFIANRVAGGKLFGQIATFEKTYLAGMDWLGMSAINGTIRVVNAVDAWAATVAKGVMTAASSGTAMITYGGVWNFAKVAPIFGVVETVGGLTWDMVVKGKDVNESIESRGGIYAMATRIVTQPFEFAKMALWLQPMMGVAQATDKVVKALLGEGRFGQTMRVLSGEHSASNLIRSGKVLFDYSGKINVEALIARNLERQAAKHGLAAQFDSAIFISGTLSASASIGTLIGSTVFGKDNSAINPLTGMTEAQEWGQSFAFWSLLFLPRSTVTGVKLSKALGVENANKLLSGSAAGDVKIKDILTGDIPAFGEMPVAKAREYIANEFLGKRFEVGSIDFENSKIAIKEIGEGNYALKGEIVANRGANVKVDIKDYGSVTLETASEQAKFEVTYDVGTNMSRVTLKEGGKLSINENTGSMKLLVKENAGSAEGTKVIEVVSGEVEVRGGKLILDLANVKYEVTDKNGDVKEESGMILNLELASRGESGDFKFNSDISFDIVRAGNDAGKFIGDAKEKIGSVISKMSEGDTAFSYKELLSSAFNLSAGNKKIVIDFIKENFKAKTKDGQKEGQEMGTEQAEHYYNRAMDAYKKDVLKANRFVDEAIGKNEVSGESKVVLEKNSKADKDGFKGAVNRYTGQVIETLRKNGVDLDKTTKDLVREYVSGRLSELINERIKNLSGKHGDNILAAAKELGDLMGVDTNHMQGIINGKMVGDAVIKVLNALSRDGIDLRPGQWDTLRWAIELTVGKTDRVLLNNPTAAGKTLSGHIIALFRGSLGLKTDILAPNTALAKQAMEGKVNGKAYETLHGFKKPVMFDDIVRQYTDPNNKLSAAEVIKILETADTLIYTQNSFFLMQNARTNGDKALMKALETRMRDTMLVLDEAHLYMKNVMDLIIAGDPIPLDALERQHFEMVFDKLQQAGLVDKDGHVEQKVVRDMVEDGGAHVAFKKTAEEKLLKTFSKNELGTAESILSGMLGVVKGQIHVDINGVKPISGSTGQIEYSRQFQDMSFILGAGKQGNLGKHNKEALYAAATRSRTVSSEGLVTIFGRFGKVLAMTGTPPDRAVAKLWGFGEAKSIGFAGGVDINYVNVSGESIPAMVKFIVDRYIANDKIQYIIQHEQVDKVMDALKNYIGEIKDPAMRQKLLDNLVRVGEDRISPLASGGYIGKIVAANKIAGLGVDYKIDLVFATDARYSEAIVRQAKGRPSRSGEYGEFHVFGEREWIDKRYSELYELKWRSTTNEILEGLGEVERFEKQKAELSGKKDSADRTAAEAEINEKLYIEKLQFIQKYMDAKDEADVCVQTVSQALRDYVIERISVSEADRALFMKEFHKNEGIEKGKASKQFNKGSFDGEMQLRNTLEVTVASLKAVVKDKAILAELNSLKLKPGEGKTGVESLTEALKGTENVMQRIVDAGYSNAKDLVPVEILFGAPVVSQQFVDSRAAKSQKINEVTGPAERYLSDIKENNDKYTYSRYVEENGNLTVAGQMLVYLVNSAGSLYSAMVSDDVSAARPIDLILKTMEGIMNSNDWEQELLSTVMDEAKKNSQSFAQANSGTAADVKLTPLYDDFRQLKEGGDNIRNLSKPGVSGLKSLALNYYARLMPMRQSKNAINSIYRRVVGDPTIAPEEKAALIDALWTVASSNPAMAGKVKGTGAYRASIMTADQANALKNLIAFPNSGFIWKNVIINDVVKSIQSGNIANLILSLSPGDSVLPLVAKAIQEIPGNRVLTMAQANALATDIAGKANMQGNVQDILEKVLFAGGLAYSENFKIDIENVINRFAEVKNLIQDTDFTDRITIDQLVAKDFDAKNSYKQYLASVRSSALARSVSRADIFEGVVDSYLSNSADNLKDYSAADDYVMSKRAASGLQTVDGIVASVSDEASAIKAADIFRRNIDFLVDDSLLKSIHMAGMFIKIEKSMADAVKVNNSARVQALDVLKGEVLKFVTDMEVTKMAELEAIGFESIVSLGAGKAIEGAANAMGVNTRGYIAPDIIETLLPSVYSITVYNANTEDAMFASILRNYRSGQELIVNGLGMKADEALTVAAIEGAFLDKCTKIMARFNNADITLEEALLEIETVKKIKFILSVENGVSKYNEVRSELVGKFGDELSDIDLKSLRKIEAYASLTKEVRGIEAVQKDIATLEFVGRLRAESQKKMVSDIKAGTVNPWMVSIRTIKGLGETISGFVEGVTGFAQGNKKGPDELLKDALRKYEGFDEENLKVKRIDVQKSMKIKLAA